MRRTTALASLMLLALTVVPSPGAATGPDDPLVTPDDGDPSPDVDAPLDSERIKSPFPCHGGREDDDYNGDGDEDPGFGLWCDFN